ncbi:Caffeine resistance protein 5 [Colletotrichum tanaceti]|uniref:Caffeine resistance protein 5 n=1 Tax=Colletotrichum tanaceti TaxID=1306861 RepID=A0A4U6XMV2_9PEZI|nr:Caffeine resistance protein 5 [Colletotrichum tanaceti]
MSGPKTRVTRPHGRYARDCGIAGPDEIAGNMDAGCATGGATQLGAAYCPGHVRGVLEPTTLLGWDVSSSELDELEACVCVAANLFLSLRCVRQASDNRESWRANGHCVLGSPGRQTPPPPPPPPPQLSPSNCIRIAWRPAWDDDGFNFERSAWSRTCCVGFPFNIAFLHFHIESTCLSLFTLLWRSWLLKGKPKATGEKQRQDMGFTDFVRDTLAWKTIRMVTGGRSPAFQYFDERHPLISQRYTEKVYERSSSAFSYASRHTETVSRTTWEKYGIETRRGLHLVEFLPNDPENPRNWSGFKKGVVGIELCLLIIAVYAGASIYTVGVHGVEERFGVSEVVALLGLTVFVLGYGVGPMVWSPLSAVPQIGRNPIYIPALVIFTLAQIPTAKATNIGMLFGFRFVAGFFGSPILGSGEGILTDLYATRKHTYVMTSFALIGICGPTLGPIVGGFAVQFKDWTWTAWIICWYGALIVVVLFFFLPETSADNILYQRTMRLRRATGDIGFVCEAQLKADSMRGAEILKVHLVRPFTLVLTEPTVFFVTLYNSFTYGFMYIWFEAMPLAYKLVYHFDTGLQNLALLGLIAGVLIAIPPFFLYYRMRIEPKYNRKGGIKPETHLHAAMIGSLLIPGSLVWFGWTAKPSIHWVIPIVGSALFTSGALLLYISSLNYLIESYPNHIASVIAGNELFTSICGATFPLVIPMSYDKLKVLGTSMILAIFAVAFVPLPYILCMRGSMLRRHSPYAKTG